MKSSKSILPSFLPFTAFPQPLGVKTAPRNSWLSKNPSPLRSKSWKMAPQWWWDGAGGAGGGVSPSLKLTAKAHENRVSQRETIIFQPSILRCYVSFRDGNLFLVMLFYIRAMNRSKSEYRIIIVLILLPSKMIMMMHSNFDTVLISTNILQICFGQISSSLAVGSNHHIVAHVRVPISWI